MKWVERVSVVAIALVLAFVGALGAWVSFATVADKAARDWHFAPGQAWAVPAAIDAFILGASAVGLYRAWKGSPIGWVRPVTWAAVALTVGLNASAAPSLAAALAHGGLPALYVLVVELVDRVLRDVARIREDQGAGIPVARWLLAPFSTAQLFRLMKLWQVTDYSQAIELERARRYRRAELCEQHGSVRKAPRMVREAYRLGEFSATPVPPEEVPPVGADVAAPPVPLAPPAEAPGSPPEEAPEATPAAPRSSARRTRQAAPRKPARKGPGGATGGRPRLTDEQVIEAARSLDDELSPTRLRDEYGIGWDRAKRLHAEATRPALHAVDGGAAR